MSRVRRSGPIILMMLLSAAAGAETTRPGVVAFRRLAIPPDVPAHLCSALATDANGFLWMGTQGGLVRYDGYRFRTYRSDPAQSATIGGSYVRSLLVTRDGRVWAGLFSGGLSVLDPATGHFTRHRHKPGVPASLADDRVEALAQDADGSLWVGTNQGVDRLDVTSGVFTHYRHEPSNPASLADDVVRALLVDRSGELWVGTRAGLQRFRRESATFERVASELSADLVSRLVEDRLGRIWVGTSNRGAAVFDPRSGKTTILGHRPLQRDGLSHYWIYGFAESAGDEMWVATFGAGIDVVDIETLRVVDRLRHDATLDTTVPNDRVGAILRDRSGTLWVGTWGTGIAWHDPSTRAFRMLRYSPSNGEGLSYPSVVRALERSDETIWAGTNGNGIDVLDAELRRVGGFRPDARDRGALADGAVTCIEESPSGDMWVATLDGTLHRMPRGSRRFHRFTQADGMPGGPIRTIAFAPDGGVWAGSSFGLARIDSRSGQVDAYTAGGRTPLPLTSVTVESIAVAPDGRLWIGTDGGLNLFDPVAETVVQIRHEAGRADSLPDNWVPDLMFDRRGRLWVGTHGGAAVLRSFDGRRARFEVVSRMLRRPGAPAEQLIEDADGQVWIGPRLRVDPVRWTARELGLAEGNAFRTFFIASRARMRDGRLLFSSPEGLLVVDPRRLAGWTYQPRVVATALRAGDRELSEGVRSLRLDAGARTFRMEVAALDLTAPERLRYRYRLEGEERQWNIADSTQRSLVYAGLRPGSYLLRVGATNRDGVWSAHELRMPVSVPAAIHERTAFRVAAGVLLAVLLYALYRVRVRQLKHREAVLEAVVAQRTRELAGKNEELTAAYAKIEDASLTDPLTGLRNRRYLEQTMDPDVEMSLRRTGRHEAEGDLIFLMVDLDRFKRVNDTWGHAAGDAVLTQIADILRATFRASDAIVRWGGEEFLVVVRFGDRARAGDMAEKLRTAVAAHPFALPAGIEIACTCSIGVAAFPFSPPHGGALPWEGVVDVADGALYLAKNSGRNAWIIVAPPPHGGHPREVAAAFRADPSGAIERGEVLIEVSRGLAPQRELTGIED